MDRPSIPSEAAAKPAMSKMVGATSMLATMEWILKKFNVWHFHLFARKNRHRHFPSWHTRATKQEGHADVELIGHGLALDQPELAQMEAVVAGEQQIGVVQLVQRAQALDEL